MAGDETLQEALDSQAPARILKDAKPASAEAKRLRAGLVGRGIAESRSPRMHEAEGARLGLSYEYRLFDFDQLCLSDFDLPRILKGLRNEGYAGVNVTHPFKERVLAHLDRLSPDAAAIGAVNTVVFGPDAAIGHNTDCWGFAESFRHGLPDAGLEEVLLIGAGGAGMAVARALGDLGVPRLAIFDIDLEKASRLVEALRTAGAHATIATDLKASIGSAIGLVNATPVGMAKYPGMPVDPGWLRAELWVADVVYFPAATELLRAAETAGCRTLPGRGMAIFQAVRAFELITGICPDPSHMARHFEAEN